VILACFDPHADGDGYGPTPNPELIYFAVGDIEATYGACKKPGPPCTGLLPNRQSTTADPPIEGYGPNLPTEPIALKLSGLEA
jgi:hypothetical protein